MVLYYLFGLFCINTIIQLVSCGNPHPRKSKETTLGIDVASAIFCIGITVLLGIEIWG